MATNQPGRGRPREQRADDAVRRATLELLEEVGYGGLSIEAVAARAGVGKPTIYRRFRSKAELVFAHAIHGPELGPVPDTGSLREDLTALTQRILETFLRPAAASVVPGLLEDGTRDPELAARLRASFVESERRMVREILDRAVTRGELARRPDIDLVHALLLGPVFCWIFLAHNPVKRGLAGRLAVHVAGALQATPARKETP
ncbi:MAG: TetR/AcrR family transcriptional regulator [Tepidiformaceae bacterium]